MLPPLEHGEGTLVGRFTTSFDHGLLIVEDVGSVANHHAWDPETELVHFDGDSLYVVVRHRIEGVVTVSVYRDRAPEKVLDNLMLRFDGAWESDHEILKISDSDDWMVLSVMVRRRQRRVQPYVDDPDWSTQVVVVISTE